MEEKMWWDDGKPDVKKVCILLPKEEAYALKLLALENNVTVTSLVFRAIENYSA